MTKEQYKSEPRQVASQTTLKQRKDIEEAQTTTTEWKSRWMSLFT